MPEFVHSGAEKKQYVQAMFDDISPRYDFLNHLLSFGLDISWRNHLVRALPQTLKYPVLDVAAGTGDVGIAIKSSIPGAVIIGLDYAFRMTEMCKKKISDQGLTGLHILQGDGEELPFPDGAFSAITISFGFRNIGHYSQALREFNRVLTTGGKLLILEFAEPTSAVFGVLYRFYFRNVLPRIGAVFSRADAYRYLPESVEHFPTRSELDTLLASNGFTEVAIKELTFGTVTLVTAIKTG